MAGESDLRDKMVLVRMSGKELHELEKLAKHYRVTRPQILRWLARQHYETLTGKRTA